MMLKQTVHHRNLFVTNIYLYYGTEIQFDTTMKAMNVLMLVTIG